MFLLLKHFVSDNSKDLEIEVNIFKEESFILLPNKTSVMLLQFLTSDVIPIFSVVWKLVEENILHLFSDEKDDAEQFEVFLQTWKHSELLAWGNDSWVNSN